MPANIQAFDLNLLVVFDAVMAERNVSRAAQKIGMSQPAVSNALNRMRDQLQDQLFIRTNDGVRPTELASEIATDVSEGLRQLQLALEPREHSKALMNWSFVLSMSEQTMISVLPGLLNVISASGKRIQLHIKPKQNSTIVSELDSMEVDIAVGTVPNLPPRFDKQLLYHERYVIMMAKNNPLYRTGVSADDFPNLDQIGVRLDLGSARRIDLELQACGTRRKVVMNVTQYQVLPKVLKSTSLIAVVPRSVILDLDQEEFFFQELPFPLKTAEVQSVVHRTRRRNAAIRWLQEALREACFGLDQRFDGLVS